MSFRLTISSPRRPVRPEDVLILSEDVAFQNTEAPIVVRLTDLSRAGHFRDSDDVTAVVSGTLTNVPAPFGPCAGAEAARAIATLYSKEGNAAFARLDGAFCFALIDYRRDSILLGRDKLGIARAYLAHDGGRLTFSDSLADLMASIGTKFSVDLDSIYAFLTIGWVPTPHSMFHGIQKLPAGAFLESRNGTLTENIYYDVPHDDAATLARDPAQLSASVADHLDRSVARGAALGGRWGSFLSGGVDSSSVVMSLSRVVPQHFPTYFGGFAPQLNRYLPNPEEPAMSEVVARRAGSNHHMLWLGPETVELTPDVVEILEEPVCDGGCIVLAALMRAAQGEADGLMTGIGGDFLFTGERRHMVLNLLRRMRRIPSPIWYGAKWVSGLPLFSKSARVSQAHFDLTRLLEIRSLSLEAMYAGFYLQAEPRELDQLLLPEVREQITRSPQEEINQFFAEARGFDPLGKFLYLDLKTQTPEHCVREVETLGRHFGIRTFSPFLDSEFVDFAMSIPSAEKISGLSLKVPLKAAMRGRVPDPVLDRKKGGLGSPIRWWVIQEGGFVAKVLSREAVESRGLFSPDAVELFRQATANGTRDFTKLLWSLFTLELWFRRFVDQAN